MPLFAFVAIDRVYSLRAGRVRAKKNDAISNRIPLFAFVAIDRVYSLRAGRVSDGQMMQ